MAELDVSMVDGGMMKEWKEYRRVQGLEKEPGGTYRPRNLAVCCIGCATCQRRIAARHWPDQSLSGCPWAEAARQAKSHDIIVLLKGFIT